jgi:hypothetical protein
MQGLTCTRQIQPHCLCTNASITVQNEISFCLQYVAIVNADQLRNKCIVINNISRHFIFFQFVDNLCSQIRDILCLSLE